jgi:hypothetical protein
MQVLSLKSLAIIALGLASTASAYTVTLWQNPDCTGDSRTDDVWDNTCSTPSPGWSSITVVSYGGSEQYARFHDQNSCAGTVIGGPWKADGSDSTFKVGKCIAFGTGNVANAAGSFAV